VISFALTTAAAPAVLDRMRV